MPLALARRLAVALDEGLADGGGDNRLLRLWHVGQRIAHEVHATGRWHTNLNWRREVRKSQLGSCSRRSSPRLERLVAEDAEATASGEMALDVEGVLDGGVNG